MTDLSEIKSELHDMRSDFKELSGELVNLTKVMVRREEGDKHLQIHVAKMDKKLESYEERIRAVEDFATKANPWISGLSKILVGVCTAAAIAYVSVSAYTSNQPHTPIIKEIVK